MTPRDGLRRPPADRVAVVTVTALLTVATVAELLDCSPWAVRHASATVSCPPSANTGASWSAATTCGLRRRAGGRRPDGPLAHAT
jgi:hypothetical protein